MHIDLAKEVCNKFQAAGWGLMIRLQARLLMKQGFECRKQWLKTLLPE